MVLDLSLAVLSEQVQWGHYSRISTACTTPQTAFKTVRESCRAFILWETAAVAAIHRSYGAVSTAEMLDCSLGLSGTTLAQHSCMNM